MLNCARGEIVNTGDIADALRSGKVGGYGADQATIRTLAAKPPEEVVDWLVEFADAFEDFELPPVEVSEEKARKELE